jgi:hypothetical protein
MKKVTKKKKTVAIVNKYCDYCGELASHHCYVCGKDLCGRIKNDCTIKVMDDHYYSDYPNYICKDCLKVKNKYRKQMDKLERRLLILEDKWMDEAKKAWINKRDSDE